MARIAGQSRVDSTADFLETARRLGPLPARWGKYDARVRAGWLAAGLALRQAQAERETEGARVGVAACGVNGSLEANRRYFSDYAQSGRTLGRSSLFVYTLPTTPIAEYAIHFGLGGPLFYAGFENGRIVDILALAEGFLNSGEADQMLVLLEDARYALGLVLVAGQQAWPEWTSAPVANLADILEETHL